MYVSIFPHKYNPYNNSSSSAVAWELGTSLSTSLEAERPPDVRLQGDFRHNVIDISASTPFFFFFFFWRILKIPKTATVTSPICQALRSARSLRHFSCFFFFFFPISELSIFFLRRQRAISSCQRTGNEDQKKKKNVFSFCFEFFKDAFLSSSLHYSVFAMDCPQWGDEML